MEDNIIITKIDRLDEKLINEYKNMSSTDIDDVLGKNSALSSSFKRFGKGKLCGSAFTVKLHASDNLVLAAALDLAQAGDVIVVDAENDLEHAVVGDLLATYSASRGIQGMIIAGAVRDVKALEEMENFVVYGKSITPNGPFKKLPGSINIPINIDGKTICPGDLIIADEDGIIVVGKEIAQATLEKAIAMTKREAMLIDKATHGINPRPVSLEMLEEVGCHIQER